MKTFLTATAICVSLAACSTTNTVQQANQPEAAPPPKAVVTTAPVVQAETEAQRMEHLRAALANKSVYFDFDDFSLKSEYQGVAKDNADFMKQFARDKVVLQGNADERGSSEYNLALGQKRAETVRKTLLMMGVSDARIEAVSYGKEKPLATCHEEKCWQENRRVDFAHTSK